MLFFMYVSVIDDENGENMASHRIIALALDSKPSEKAFAGILF